MSLELIEVQQQEVDQLKTEGADLVKRAEALVIVDETTCLRADEDAAECDRRVKYGKAKLEKTRAPLYEAYQNILALIREVTGPYEKAKEILNRKIYAWRKEEKRKREAQAAADREAERKRIEDERLLQAQKVSDAGRPDLADKIMTEKVVVKAPEPPKVAAAGGSTDKENWKGKVVDENLIPREFMTPDLVKLNKVTKAMKGSTRIAGWEVWDEGTIARRQA